MPADVPHDEPPEDTRPWERPGAVRRDCEPHRATLLLFLATAALLLGLSSFCLLFTGWVAVPMGWAVEAMARRDLARMQEGTMDPEGRGQVEQAKRLAEVAIGLSVVWFLCGLPPGAAAALLDVLDFPVIRLSPPPSGLDLSPAAPADAIRDGVLMYVSALDREAGLRYPVALTPAVWEGCVAVPLGVLRQDEAGRLWNVLWTLRWAIARLDAGCGRCEAQPTAPLVLHPPHPDRLPPPPDHARRDAPPVHDCGRRSQRTARASSSSSTMPEPPPGPVEGAAAQPGDSSTWLSRPESR